MGLLTMTEEKTIYDYGFKVAIKTTDENGNVVVFCRDTTRAERIAHESQQTQSDTV